MKSSIRNREPGSSMIGLECGQEPIASQYVLRKQIKKVSSSTIYEGIDIKNCRYVTVYARRDTAPFAMKRISPELRNKISPEVLWSGLHKVEDHFYNIEVHEKKGPSLRSLLIKIGKRCSARDLLHLLYQLVLFDSSQIRLIERYTSSGLVHRLLSPDSIVLDSSAQKSEVFLLNTHNMRKEGQLYTIKDSKFCSRGAHLGLRSHIKDDLESICYIMFYIWSNGMFLNGVAIQDYLDAKAKIDFGAFNPPLPPLIFQFYAFVIGLNYKTDVNFYQWRNKIIDKLGRNILQQPYQWIYAPKQATVTEKKDAVEQKECPEEQDVGTMQEIEDGEWPMGQSPFKGTLFPKIMDNSKHLHSA